MLSWKKSNIDIDILYSFDEAASSEFVQLIPSSFLLPDPNNLANTITIQTGSDPNESGSEGQSRTQDPRGYVFQFGDRLIRLIDTPGIGDTRGMDVDKENFNKILQYLHYYQALHGICILVKANQTRKTVSFRYCITELLAHLHQKACQNIVFCFTYSKSSLFGPGDGFVTLCEFLENDLIDVQLEPTPGENCFFVDNEAFRFLAAKKQSYPFEENHWGMFEESWNESVEQTKSMIEHILSLEPHQLKVQSCPFYLNPPDPNW